MVYLPDVSVWDPCSGQRQSLRYYQQHTCTKRGLVGHQLLDEAKSKQRYIRYLSPTDSSCPLYSFTLANGRHSAEEISENNWTGTSSRSGWKRPLPDAGEHRYFGDAGAVDMNRNM